MSKSDANGDYDYIVKSPSICLDDEVFLKLKGEIISDIELVYLFAKPNVIAVTASNGKTTCVELLYNALKTKYKVVKCGNIGYSFARAYIDNLDADYFIVEVSSFMLEATKYFDPLISVILNISKAHLDHHKTLNAYLDSKLNICRYQNINNICIYNYDDPLLNKIKDNTVAKLIPMSIENSIGDLYLLGNSLYDKGNEIYHLSDLELKYRYKLYSYLVVLKIGNLLGINNKKLIKVIKNFKGVEYRNERIGKFLINDAKSTNCSATENALLTLDGNTILICGGFDRGMSFNLSNEALKRINRVYAYGETKMKLYNFFNGYNIIVDICDNLDEAFEKASLNRGEKEVILYSPMCASFDQFSSYIDRGKRFNSLAKKYKYI